MLVQDGQWFCRECSMVRQMLLRVDLRHTRPRMNSCTSDTDHGDLGKQGDRYWPVLSRIVVDKETTLEEHYQLLYRQRSVMTIHDATFGNEGLCKSWL